MIEPEKHPSVNLLLLNDFSGIEGEVDLIFTLRHHYSNRHCHHNHHHF